MSSLPSAGTETITLVLSDIRAHLGGDTPDYVKSLKLLDQILNPSNSRRHISQCVIDLANLLEGVPMTFYKLNTLFYPVRVDLDVQQRPITSFVLKTSDSCRIVILDSQADWHLFHNLSMIQFKDILLYGNSGSITYEKLNTITDAALQGCFAQLAQNILDDPITSPDCRREALEFLMRLTCLPPSLFLHDLVVLEPVTFTPVPYLCNGIFDNMKVVIKRPRVSLDPRDCQQVIREIVLYRQIHHPNILPFLGATFDPQIRLCGLVTPYMKNGDLLKFLERNPNLERITPIWQITKGLKFLHHFNPPIAHQDIRCANVLVNDNLVCCLSDFGLSSTPELSQRSRPAAIGPRSWMAPELLSTPGHGQIDLLKTDIYSLGITILEVYCGYAPGMVELQKIKDAPAGTSSGLLKKRYSLPPYLSEIVLPMLDLEPSARLSVQMVCQALEDNFDIPEIIELQPNRIPLSSDDDDDFLDLIEPQHSPGFFSSDDDDDGSEKSFRFQHWYRGPTTRRLP